MSCKTGSFFLYKPSIDNFVSANIIIIIVFIIATFYVRLDKSILQHVWYIAKPLEKLILCKFI